MRAAVHKANSTHTHIDLRDPDALGMYTFNDHHGYGWVQVFQNLVLDYQVARLRGDWRQQWLVCTAIGRISTQAYMSPMFMIDDSEGLTELFVLIASLFLDMLETLEGAGQLDAASTEIKDLGQIMSVFILLTQQLRKGSILEEPVPTRGKRKKPKTLDAELFDEYIVSYAQRHNIMLHLPEPYRKKAAEQTRAANPDMLPKPAGEAGAASRKYWGFESKLKKYTSEYKGLWATNSKQKDIIGRDSLDITSWKPAERKQKAFNQGKDPLSDEVVKALKNGMIVGLG